MSATEVEHATSRDNVETIQISWRKSQALNAWEKTLRTSEITRREKPEERRDEDKTRNVVVSGKKQTRKKTKGN